MDFKHVCKNPELFLVEERQLGDQAILEMREEAVYDVVSQGEGDVDPEIFLHSLTRSINTKTMRVLGKIGWSTSGDFN